MKPALLFISTQFPFPPRNGVTGKCFHYLRHLAAAYEVTLVSFVEPGEEPPPAALAQARELCREVHVVATLPRSAPRALLRGQPAFTSRFASPAAMALVGRLTRERAFRVAHFDTVGTLPLVRAVATPETRTVASVNDTYALMLEHLRPAGARRLAHAVNRALVRRFERRWYPRFGQVHFVSEVDCRYVRALSPSARVHCVPLGVDAERFRGFEDREEPRTLVFCADMSEGHGESIVRFARTGLPLVRRRVPGARLLVVGRNPPPELLALARADAGVEVTGWVNDVRPHVARGAVAISLNPLPGGIQTKVLEAMALARPVVGLPQNFVAFEGARDGTHFVSAPTPEAVAEAAARLLDAPAARAAIGNAARALVARRFDWVAVVERYLRLLESDPPAGRAHDGYRGAPREPAAVADA